MIIIFSSCPKLASNLKVCFECKFSAEHAYSLQHNISKTTDLFQISEAKMNCFKNWKMDRFFLTAQFHLQRDSRLHIDNASM